MEETDRPTMGVGMSVVTGLLLIVAGIIMLADPKMSLTFFIWVFGLGVITYGVLHAVAALMGKKDAKGETQKAAGVTGGVLAVIAGVLVIAWPGMTAGVMIYIVAGWAIFTGVVDLARVFMPGASAGGRIWHLISGVAGIVLGLIIMLYPADGILTILWLVGIYLIVLGFLRIITGVFAPASRLGPSANEPHPF